MYFWIFSIIVSYSFAINQLSFSGGGSFGAVEIGILKRLVELESFKYDLYTGISAGGLNAGYLSYFDNVNRGVESIETLYCNLKNKNVYEMLPRTGNSMFNTKPLHETLGQIIEKMPNQPVVHTLIGTTNLDTGWLDIYEFNKLSTDDKINLLMATSAIPVIFPPVFFNQHYYVDGGVLSNELLNVKHFDDYLNITYITTYSEHPSYNSDFTTMKKVAERTFDVVKQNFNNPLNKLNQNCMIQSGEINMYYVDAKYLKNYSILNFDQGKELIDVGYYCLKTKKYKLC
jgi:predicted acylesterase/phospholipase RssA